MSIIDKLERKFGRYAIKNLIYYILGGYAVGYILAIFDDALGLYQYITLEPALVMKGQVWRLFTWIFTPPQSLNLWVIFMFMLYYFIGKALEQNMGAFRYNLYIFSGWFFMTLGAMLVYWISNAVSHGSYSISMDISTYYINMASFLAFAVIYPDMRLYLFGIIPIKVKWLAWFDVIYLGLEIFSSIALIFTLTTGGSGVSEVTEILNYYGYTSSYTVALAITEIFSIVISLLNFLIFFLSNRNFKRLSPHERQRRANFRRSAEAGKRENASRMAGGFAAGGAAASSGRKHKEQKNTYRPAGSSAIVHRCAVCGRTSKDYPDLQFRYCSKCAGNHEYCQDHIFTHEHVK